MGEKHAGSVIGFLIDEALAVPNAPALPTQARSSLLAETKTARRLKQLADTATTARDKAAIDAFEDLVVRLPAQTYGTTEFDMTAERRATLIASGQAVTAAYLDQRLKPRPAAR